jgi:hypothetical protein
MTDKAHAQHLINVLHDHSDGTTDGLVAALAPYTGFATANLIVGDWFKAIASGMSPEAKVGDVLTEEQIRDLLCAAMLDHLSAAELTDIARQLANASREKMQ